VVQVAAKADVDADVLVVSHAQVAEDSPVALADQAVAVTLVALVEEVMQDAQAVLAEASQDALVVAVQVDQVAVADSQEKAQEAIVQEVNANRSVVTVNDLNPPNLIK
jgi:hypothetical protein